MKNKAREELEKNLEQIENRKYMIIETIIGLKDKVSKDVSNLRVNSTVINN